MFFKLHHVLEIAVEHPAPPALPTSSNRNVVTTSDVGNTTPDPETPLKVQATFTPRPSPAVLCFYEPTNQHYVANSKII